MRTVVHISDLHFGVTETMIENALRDVIVKRAPDLVIVSGDITQRATERQFKLAQNFFYSLPCQVFAVPGNHDIPLYSMPQRLINPYKLYKKYISKNLEMVYEDDEIIIIGLNTVRTLKMMEGRVNKKQIKWVKDTFSTASTEKIKILVSHHPFNVPVGHIKRPLARARLFWKSHKDTGIDMILSGHLHTTFELDLNRAYKLSSYGHLLVQAGTAISTRYRKEGNLFNIINITKNNIVIDRYKYARDKQKFIIKKTESFVRQDKIWKRDLE